MPKPRQNNPAQRPLLDAAGLPAFDFQRDTYADWDDKADVHVERMPFTFCWKANADTALPLALAALTELSRLPSKYVAAWSAAMRPLDVELWEPLPETDSAAQCRNDLKVCAFVRYQDDDDEIIRVYLYRGLLAISLPHPSYWSECNLLWLTDWPRCCARNCMNSSPWHGPCCNCKA